MNIIIVIAFFLSLFGFYLGYGVFVKRSNAFFPVLYIAFTVLALYVFGIAGILKIGSYLIPAMGLALIPVTVVKNRSGVAALCKNAVTDPSLLFMAAGAVWIFFITRGVGVSHTDDFSHWYLICKVMHIEGAYPTTPDVSFTTYAPGTATWIWFMTSITGFAPDKCFFAHSLINLAALNTFFCLADEAEGEKASWAKKAAVFAFTVVMSVVLCSMNVNTYCLLTDTTIALVPMAALFFVLSDGKKGGKMSSILFTALMCFEILIKVSGIPFVVFVTIYRNMYVQKTSSSSRLRSIGEKLIPIAIPVALFYVYVIRAGRVFGSLETAGQGFSLTRFLAMFMIKTGDQINAIVKRFLYEMFAITGDISMQVRLLWLVFAALLVALLVLRKKKDEGIALLKKSTVMLFVFFAAYSIVLLLTYLFSMYENEADAQHLNCFYRYIGSVTLFVCAVVAFLLFRIFSGKKGSAGYLLNGGLCAVSIAIGLLMFDMGYIAGYSYYRPVEHFTTNAWDLLNAYAPEREDYNEDTYFVVYNTEDVIDDYAMKTRLASVVYFRTRNVCAYSVEDLEAGNIGEDRMEMIRQSDYLVTLGDLSGHLDVIGEYVDIEDYAPGMIDLKGE